MNIGSRHLPARKTCAAIAPQECRCTQQGFSLVELMIAMALGLMLVTVIVSIFVSSNRNYKEDDRFARMQENGRFAIYALQTDLSMASFWGTTTSPSGITNAVGTASSCGLTFDTSSPVLIINNPASGTAISGIFSCISSTSVWTGGTTHADVIAIKRVVGEITPADSSSTTSAVYLEMDADPSTNIGALKLIAPSSFNSTKAYWRYMPRIYHIRNYSVTSGDGIPTLCRKELNGTAMTDVPLVEGVENIQIEFGIDTDGDGAPNKYDPAPSGADLNNIVNAKLYVLARSLDRDPIYTNDKTYNLGSVTLDYSDAPDNYYRRVFEGTISLRNVSGYSQLGAL
jgi:type IV pilus assembly protein PilW